jgi:hypothetical protein
MHICFKIIKFLLHSTLLYIHHCVHHQESSTTAHAASGYLSNYKQSVCLQVMCEFIITYNMFYILVKICFWYFLYN